jgi:hypothetical protein
MTLEEKSEGLEVVSEAIQLKRTGRNRAELTLSNGVVLDFRPVTPSLIGAVRTDLEAKYPSPPVTYLEAKGRDEPNPNDPAYQDQLRRAMARTEQVLNDLVIAAGCDIRQVPEGVAPLESDDWLQDPRIVAARSLGLEFDPADPIKRKCVWLQYYAVENWADDRLFQSMPAQVAGISEAEVMAALASFRGDPERGPDTGPAPADPSLNGNRGQRRAGRNRR